jgi:transposase
MTATHDRDSTIPTVPVLYFSLELSNKSWKLAVTTGLGQKLRLRTVAARDTDALLAEIARAKKRFCLPYNAGIASCHEAGRNGFWLHRYLLELFRLVQQLT